MPQQHLHVNIHNSPEEAPHYHLPEFHDAKIVEANIVRKGTEAGLSTVDLVVQDTSGVSGQKLVVRLSGRLIHTLAALIGEQPEAPG